MNAPVTPATSLAPRPAETSLVSMGFGSLQSFEFMQRTAKMFTVSSMVPTAYRAQIKEGYGDNARMVDNPAALPNCIIALNMSQRMNADPLMIMQNLHVIEGRPSWSSQFIIAAINSCGRYSPLRFDIEDGDEIDAEHTTFEWVDRKKVAKTVKVRVKNMTCVAWAIELATNTRLQSPKVTMEMAVNEGWYGKNGSKWQSMPDLMIRYRSAAFFGRIYAPELLMGLPSAEETGDIIDVRPQADGSFAADPLPTSARQAKPSTAEDAAVKTFYPDADFAKALPGWLKLIATKKKTTEQIVATAELKHPLSEAQKQAIVNPPDEEKPVGTAGPASDAPVVTYAQVADQLNKAQNLDDLDTAGDLIGAVADPAHRTELSAMFETRKTALIQ